MIVVSEPMSQLASALGIIIGFMVLLTVTFSLLTTPTLTALPILTKPTGTPNVTPKPAGAATAVVKSIVKPQPTQTPQALDVPLETPPTPTYIPRIIKPK